MARQRICSIDGCGKPHEGRGWCSIHYQRYRRLGSPLSGGTFHGEPQRFIDENAVTAQRDDGCVIWPFNVNNQGYGTIVIGRKQWLASRVVCERVHGVAPTPKHQAAHSCGNGHNGCVSGYHLRWATAGENQKERFEHSQALGAAHPVAKITAQDVLFIRSQRGSAKGKDLARKYNVAPNTIYSIWSGKTWAWL